MDKELEVLKERLKFQTELLKLLTALFAANAGGIAGIMFKLKNPISILLLILGLITLLGFILAIFRVGIAIENTFKELEKWKHL
jgi:hypothetical protein